VVSHLNTENDEVTKEELEVIKRWACLHFYLDSVSLGIKYSAESKE